MAASYLTIIFIVELIIFLINHFVSKMWKEKSENPSQFPRAESDFIQNGLFYPSNSPKWKDIQFTVIQDKDKQKILTF